MARNIPIAGVVVELIAESAQYLAELRRTNQATGGPVTRGSTYLVGEKGPELFTASNSGSIIPNNQLDGGGTVVNIYNEARADVQTNTRQPPQGDVIEIMLRQVEGRMNEQINRGRDWHKPWKAGTHSPVTVSDGFSGNAA